MNRRAAASEWGLPETKVNRQNPVLKARHQRQSALGHHYSQPVRELGDGDVQRDETDQTDGRGLLSPGSSL